MYNTVGKMSKPSNIINAYISVDSESQGSADIL